MKIYQELVLVFYSEVLEDVSEVCDKGRKMEDLEMISIVLAMKKKLILVLLGSMYKKMMIEIFSFVLLRNLHIFLERDVSIAS